MLINVNALNKNVIARNEVTGQSQNGDCRDLRTRNDNVKVLITLSIMNCLAILVVTMSVYSKLHFFSVIAGAKHKTHTS
jgi:hypothetical protein